MRNRKTFLRKCKYCLKEEYVRSDQKNFACVACNSIIQTERLLNYRKENPGFSNTTNLKHGLWQHRIYRIHKSMMERCGHTTYRHKFARYYADRGISVCEEWKNRVNFFNWSFSNGYSDKLQIDRINPDDGYSPRNCRWVTPKENQANRRDRRANISNVS